MKCENCESEATVHEVRISGGKRHETHLCEQCAREQGLNIQTPTPITQLLTQFITSQTGAEEGREGTDKPAEAAVNTVCPACRTTWAQFRASGLLGCAECYAAFEGQLVPLLARAHEGGEQHVGKSPRAQSPGATAGTRRAPVSASERSAAPKPAADAQIAALRSALEEAIAHEQYEEAARLRDELARLEGRAKATRKRAGRPGDPGPGKGAGT